MKEFFDVVKKHRISDDVSILGVISMTGGYLLAVEYSWEDGSFREDAIFIVREEYGPNKGQYRLGFTHQVHEHESPELPEPKMREWGPNHPEYDPNAPIGKHPSDWNGDEPVFRNGSDYPKHLQGKKFVDWNWGDVGSGNDIVSYPIK